MDFYVLIMHGVVVTRVNAVGLFIDDEDEYSLWYDYGSATTIEKPLNTDYSVAYNCLVSPLHAQKFTYTSFINSQEWSL